MLRKASGSFIPVQRFHRALHEEAHSCVTLNPSISVLRPKEWKRSEKRRDSGIPSSEQVGSNTVFRNWAAGSNAGVLKNSKLDLDKAGKSYYNDGNSKRDEREKGMERLKRAAGGCKTATEHVIARPGAVCVKA